MTDDEKVRLWLAHYDDDTRRRVLAFAKRIEEAERERCAKIAELSRLEDWAYIGAMIRNHD